MTTHVPSVQMARHVAFMTAIVRYVSMLTMQENDIVPTAPTLSNARTTTIVSGTLPVIPKTYTLEPMLVRAYTMD